MDAARCQRAFVFYPPGADMYISLNLRLNVHTHAQQGLKSPLWFGVVDALKCEHGCGDAYTRA
jgi:hypothetical protein